MPNAHHPRPTSSANNQTPNPHAYPTPKTTTLNCVARHAATGNTTDTGKTHAGTAKQPGTHNNGRDWNGSRRILTKWRQGNKAGRDTPNWNKKMSQITSKIGSAGPKKRPRQCYQHCESGA